MKESNMDYGSIVFNILKNANLQIFKYVRISSQITTFVDDICRKTGCHKTNNMILYEKLSLSGWWQELEKTDSKFLNTFWNFSIMLYLTAYLLTSLSASDWNMFETLWAKANVRSTIKINDQWARHVSESHHKNAFN